VEKIQEECCLGILEFLERRVPLAMESTHVNIFNSITKLLTNAIVDSNKQQLLERMR
tara:strand:- start:1100 stop:1270 length:171 start_codon:yes stop_codon:yes gene_type:complete